MMKDDDYYPDVSAWRYVMELTIQQAALLCAGMNPMDFNECAPLSDAENRNHSRWKIAKTYALAMVSAIRQGVLATIACYHEQEDYSGDVAFIELDPSNRGFDISTRKTLLAKASLYGWIKREKITIPRPTKAVVPALEPDNAVLISPPKQSYRCSSFEVATSIAMEISEYYDYDDPRTHPKKQDIIDKALSHGFSKGMSQSIANVIHPDKLRGGGRPINKTPATINQ